MGTYTLKYPVTKFLVTGYLSIQYTGTQGICIQYTGIQCKGYSIQYTGYKGIRVYGIQGTKGSGKRV